MGATSVPSREVGVDGSVFDDPVAFRRWYEVAMPVVYRYLHGRCGGDAALAEELTQQAFIQAVDRHEGFEGRADPVTWVVAIARNKLVDHWRQLEREERRRMRLVVREIAVDPDVAPWRQGEDRLAVLAALRALPAAQQGALVLRYVDGMSVRDVARTLGRSEGATESLLSRGRERFRQVYQGDSHG